MEQRERGAQTKKSHGRRILIGLPSERSHFFFFFGTPRLDLKGKKKRFENWFFLFLFPVTFQSFPLLLKGGKGKKGRRRALIIQVELCLWFSLLLLLLYYYYSLYSSSISLCPSVGGFLGGGIFSVQLFALPPPLMTFLSLLSLPSRLSLSPFVSALLCKLFPSLSNPRVYRSAT